MPKTIVFQDSFLVSGIMCFSSCGTMIQNLLSHCLDELKEEKLLASDAQLTIDAEPGGLGIHRLILTIESEEAFQENQTALLSSRFKDCVGFDIVDEDHEGETSTHTNWLNILVNSIGLSLILALYLLFPPALPLTIILTVVSVLTTAFTARSYLIQFYHNLRNRTLANMTSSITLGWFLSLAHTLFHVISMPLLAGFSMVFMCFIMPILLITFINAMDEIKRLVLNKSKTMNLANLKTLFPQMSEYYSCHKLDKELSQELIKERNFETIHQFLSTKEFTDQRKNLLQEGMIIEIKRGECFPVDCLLIDKTTIIDASLVTGESQQLKNFGDKIPAGAINFGQTVKVYALKSSYNSTINQLLFPANRARTNSVNKSTPKFYYFYSGLILLGIIAAIVAPVALGILTVPLLLQNVMGILFSVCFCTIVIAHKLPKLISVFHRNKKGIQLRDESLTASSEEFHTIVFDKTGTLTTGNSTVESSNLSSALWERVYLLEKQLGADHPLGKAIINHYENRFSNSKFNKVQASSFDEKNRGLSAIVQGKRIHIGNAAYLKEAKIDLPELDPRKLGFTPVYVAEEGICQGVIYIQHEVRPGILDALSRLKREGKKIIMLTGDSQSAALAFNKQIGSLFEKEDIYAEQTPQDKEKFLKELMDSPDKNPKGVWFIGDGLNDAPCARIVSEKGGISCAMNASDKAVFFTDLCLNGSIDYLFHHQKINKFLEKNVLENQGILTLSTLAFLAFIISFSVAGLAVSPLIPLVIMSLTTIYILFNSYRVQLLIDNTLDKITSWPKKLLASDLSIALLLVASTLLISGLLIATIASGGLALPAIVFTAGTIFSLSSGFTVAAIALYGLFAILVGAHFVAEASCEKTAKEQDDLLPQPEKILTHSSFDLAESPSYEFNIRRTPSQDQGVNLGKEELLKCSYI